MQVTSRGVPIINNSIECASFKISSTIKLTKSGTYSGIQVPFDATDYNYGNIFSLNSSDGKIYCSKHAIIKVSVSLSVADAASNIYVLLGRNGSYIYTLGPAPSNGLAGSSLSGSYEFEINANEYITLQLGSPSAFTDKTVYNGSRLTASVVRILE